MKVGIIIIPNIEMHGQSEKLVSILPNVNCLNIIEILQEIKRHSTYDHTPPNFEL
jgi:hypothetical protein